MSEERKLTVMYLIEFRQRLIYCLLLFSIIFFILIFFANEIFNLLAGPLLKYLPNHQGLIATNLLAPFFVPVELTLVVALFLSIPFILYHAWVFIAPALYENEKNFFLPFILLSASLFYAGMMFAYFIIFPILFKFFIQTTPQSVMLIPDINIYLNFSLKLLFLFGIIFEVPIVVTLLVWSNLVKREALIGLRPYVILMAFIIGMLFAPPDVISQTLLAVSFWFLFEIGLLLARFFKTRGANKK